MHAVSMAPESISEWFAAILLRRYSIRYSEHWYSECATYESNPIHKMPAGRRPVFDRNERRV